VTNGPAAYESAVQVAIDLAQRTQELIVESDYLEMVRPSSLSIVLFRRLGWDADRYNEWSHDLLRRQIAFVTPTKWEGETVGRIAFLHPNTTEEMIVEILNSMRD
jgi:glutamate/tyrosine decarboxylase-like PLP-dependent enzyme